MEHTVITGRMTEPIVVLENSNPLRGQLDQGHLRIQTQSCDSKVILRTWGQACGSVHGLTLGLSCFADRLGSLRAGTILLLHNSPKLRELPALLDGSVSKSQLHP